MSDDLGSVADLERVFEKFERAWQGSPRPVIEDYLPADPPRRSRVLRELVLTEMELRLRAGEAARCEKYFARFPELAADSSAAISLVALEFNQRARREPGLAAADFLRRFPQLAPELEKRLLATTDGKNETSVTAPRPDNDGPATTVLPPAHLIGDDRRAGEDPRPGQPERIGRYRIRRPLGQGGFGLVYLADDEQLTRRVAIKVPHARLVARPDAAENYLREARMVANLDHPSIVPVFDIGGSEQFPCYIVSKYIDGTNLAMRLKESRLPPVGAAELVATVAEALHYAHKRGLVHRDIKPANILIDNGGQPFVTDFGLAVQEQESGNRPCYVGTPAYMSPEQARGEGHRVDGRSDIFSLGVVLYELIVGVRPFKADDTKDLLERVRSVEVRPPRQIDDRIPKELERICLKALAKKAAERYTTAKDMADDLRHWIGTLDPEHIAAEARSKAAAYPPVGELQLAVVVRSDGSTLATPATLSAATVTPPATLLSDNRPLVIIPKGLRSFDAQDAEFFLELLPGPRDRDGLPDSIRFWKSRAEQTDPEETFCVGLIYGPSGCGKSSLVKAGLLPRLSADVISVYIEATAEETETRLLNGLRKRCPILSDDLELKETIAALRRGEDVPAGKKVLIVIDQFEQWLHAKGQAENLELVEALRQCDGPHVQCIVMVRDDFWLAVSRFMRELEIDLIPGRNIALVDLFDVDHARRVLTAFGRAFGKLPEKSNEITKQQREFVEQGTLGLTQENKVVSVRLALFAEMTKGKPWTPETLKEVGGAEGVGVAFLEETFSSPTANPRHRLHQRAARALLKALLPDSGADIKGHMRSHADLLTASGLTARPKDFHDLIRILDGELRLITPTDPEGAEEVAGEEGQGASEEGQGTKGKGQGASVGVPALAGARPPEGGTPTELRVSSEEESAAWNSSPRAPRYYQLTHDYLVPSLREWLTRKQRETRRGRAELTLVGRTAQWVPKPENRFLPSLAEFLRIRLLTDRPHWTEPQRRMMAKAGRVHGIRSGIVAAIMVVAILTGVIVRNNVLENQRAARAEVLVDSLATAEVAQVPALINALQECGTQARPLLVNMFEKAEVDSDQRLYAAVALMPNESKMNYLLPRLLTVNPQQFPIVFQALIPSKDRVIAVSQAELAQVAPKEARESEKDDLAERQANAAVALLRCGAPERVWPLLQQSADPRVRSNIVHRLGPLGGDPQPIVKRLDEETDVTIRRALVLMLGEFSDAQLPIAMRQPLCDKLLVVYENEADPGLHAAAEWLLRKWKQEDRVQAVVAKLRGKAKPAEAKAPADRPNWFVNSQGQAFVVLDAGEFLMGSPESEPYHFVNETQHHVHIGRRVAIATTHVTKAQYSSFQQAIKEVANLAEDPRLAGVVQTKDSPQTAMSWYDAARYCNWLSKQEGLPECYEPNDKGEYGEGMKAKDKYLELSGYRLPTEAEWEFSCRAGTVTSRYYGLSESLLPRYAWYAVNGQNRTWPVANLKPNDYGLFDMLGNAFQWCDDANPKEPEKIVKDLGSTAPVSDLESRIIRGGSFDQSSRSVRSAYRGAYKPNAHLNFIGFRLARTCP